MSETSLRTVISGSYRRHLKELYVLKGKLENMGIHVQSPIGSSALNPEDEFVILDADPINDRRILQDTIFAKIRNSSFLVLANINGYIGNAALMEVGYALAFGMQILCLEPVEDPNIRPYTRLLNDVFPIFQIQESLCKN